MKIETIKAVSAGEELFLDYALDIDASRVETLPASAVVLATGGVGKVYRYTSNPDTATGDGIDGTGHQAHHTKDAEREHVHVHARQRGVASRATSQGARCARVTRQL